MPGGNPHPAGTGERGNFTKQTARIVRHRIDCANCGGRLLKGEHGNCRQCTAWLAIYARTVEIARLLQAVQP